MKRILLCMGFALIALSLAFGQSLQDNSYFQESLRLKAMAAEAFDEGDYDAAADYAAQAQEYAALSDEYVAKMIELKAAQDAVDAAGAAVETPLRVQVLPVSEYPPTAVLLSNASLWENQPGDGSTVVGLLSAEDADLGKSGGPQEPAQFGRRVVALACPDRVRVAGVVR